MATDTATEEIHVKDAYLGKLPDGIRFYVSIDWDGQRLSISGVTIRKGGQFAHDGDWLGAGQNIDDLPAGNDRLREIWKNWHLNDMQAGCEHQRERGWTSYDLHPSEPCPVCGYKYGTAWLRKDVPADVIAELRDLAATL
jgi:hypothetical protein